MSANADDIAMPRWAICGRGRCGKDTAGLWLAAHTPMRFVGSTSHYLLPHVCERTGTSPAEAWASRRANRDYWYRLGKELRDADPLCLLRASLEENDVVAGCRDAIELVAAREAGLLDLIIWIERDVPEDPTLEYGPELSDVTIRNDGTLDGFHLRLERFVRNTRVPLLAPASLLQP